LETPSKPCTHTQSYNQLHTQMPDVTAQFVDCGPGKNSFIIQFSQQISVSGKKVHQTSLHTSPGVRLHLVGLVLRFQNPRRGYSLFSVFCYGLQSVIHHLLKGLRRNCKGGSSKHVAKDTLHVAASNWHSSTLCLHTSAGFFFLPQVWLLPSCLKFSSVKQN